MFDELNQQIEERKQRIQMAKELIDNLPSGLAEVEGVKIQVDIFGDLDLRLPLNDKILNKVIRLIAPNFKLYHKCTLSNGSPCFSYKLRNDKLSADLIIILSNTDNEKYSTCEIVQVGSREELKETPIFEMVCEDGKSRSIEDLV